MTSSTKKSAYSEIEHFHVELIHQLEQNQFIFAQDPDIITKTLKTNTQTPFDKLFLRAKAIDSNKALYLAIENGLFYIKLTKKLSFSLYFIIGFLSTFALLEAKMVNFFYIILALIGWHSLTLIWWIVGLFIKKPSNLNQAILDKLLLQSPIVHRLFYEKNTVNQTIVRIFAQNIEPVKTWYLATIIHANWLFALFGSVCGLFLLFLFKQYDFVWESTLLNDTHFSSILQALTFIPDLLGINTFQLHTARRADLAWLTIFSILFYGILPRLLAFFYSKYRAKHRFYIDISLPYYQNLYSQFNEMIVDQDDFRPKIPTASTFKPLSNHFILAALERKMRVDTHIKIDYDFGVVDDLQSIHDLLKIAEKMQTQIMLVIYAQTVADRGILRKIDMLSKNPAGLCVYLQPKNATHEHSWKNALQERNIIIYQE